MKCSSSGFYLQIAGYNYFHLILNLFNLNYIRALASEAFVFPFQDKDLHWCILTKSLQAFKEVMAGVKERNILI